VPAYGGDDVFVLNGADLVACVSGVASPSCAAGGTHATENESYVRVKHLIGTIQWELTDRFGTKTVLSAVGTIANVGTLTPGTEAYNLAYQYRWLVTSVADTPGNVASYSYVCPSLPTCHPETITYNGTTIRFYREARPHRLLVANGRTLSAISTRIRTIAVQTGGALRSVYAIEYDQAPVSGASRLRKIRQFGRDATVSASGAVSGGTERPQTVFAYAGLSGQYDTVQLGTGEGGNQAPVPVYQFHDLDRDGRSEILSAASNSSSAIVRSATVLNALATRSTVPLGVSMAEAVDLSMFGRYVAGKKEAYWLFMSLYATSAKVVEFNGALAPSVATCPSSPTPVPAATCPVAKDISITIDPDGDGVDQVLSLPFIRGSTGELVAKSDFYGDGKERVLAFLTSDATARLYQHDGSTWTSGLPEFRNTAGALIAVKCGAPSGGGTMRVGCRVGDFSGEGVDDVLELTTSYNCTIDTCSISTTQRMFFGTGSRFQQQEFQPGKNQGLAGLSDQAAVADLDGDGRMELFAAQMDASSYSSYLNGGTYPSVAGNRFALTVISYAPTSTGLDFGAVSGAPPLGGHGVGDFNGDGMADTIHDVVTASGGQNPVFTSTRYINLSKAGTPFHIFSSPRRANSAARRLFNTCRRLSG
jgi:hypothetical protein